MATPAVVKSSSRTGGTDTYLTPKWLLDAVKNAYSIGLDVCTEPSNPVDARLFFTMWNPDEAFITPWEELLLGDEVAWCNPPYGELAWSDYGGEDFDGWGDLIHYNVDHLSCPVISLLPSRTDRGWFRLLASAAHGMVFLKERVGFLDKNGNSILDANGKPTKAPFPSVVMSFNCTMPRGILEAGLSMRCV